MYHRLGEVLKKMIILKDAVFDLMVNLKMDEIVVFVGDLNEHVGKKSDGYGDSTEDSVKEKERIMGQRFWSWVMQWR